MRLLLLTVLLLLSGCALTGPPGPADQPREDPGPAAAAPAVMTQTGCASFYSHHEATPAWAQERMPPGFTPYPRGSGALFTTKTWSCTAAEVDGNASDVGVVSLHYLAVQPPEPLQREDAVFYWLPLEIMTGPDGLAVFHAWGFPASRLAGHTFDHTDAEPIERLHAEASSDRSRLVVDVAITEQAPGGAFLVRYFAVQDGNVTGALDITVHRGARGSGVALLELTGPDAPFSGSQHGDGAFQGWADDALSYTWVYTPL